MRKPLVAANWKMNKTVEETEAFIRAFLDSDAASAENADVVVCPPYLSLARAVELVEGTPLRIVAQNMHQEPEGAFTGEVSAPMLAEAGVHGTLLGHSERRALFGETDEALAEKVPAAIAAGLLTILCVGETESERDAGATERVLRGQVQRDIEDVPEDRLPELVIAYEPVWAIGTGRTATPDQAQEAISFVRALIADRSVEAARQARVLYGGSVKPENAAELLSQPDIDGALVGGASLDPGAFAEIVAAAR